MNPNNTPDTKTPLRTHHRNGFEGRERKAPQGVFLFATFQVIERKNEEIVF